MERTPRLGIIQGVEKGGKKRKTRKTVGGVSRRPPSKREKRGKLWKKLT